MAAVSERNEALVEAAMTLALMAGKIRDQARDLSKSHELIAQLRALIGRPQLQKSKTELNAFVGELLSAYPAHEGIVFEGNFSGPTLQATVDAEQLGRAVRSLIDNAVEAMPSGGTIVVSTARLDDGSAMITVTDRGVGIAKELLGRVFEPFYTTKPSGAGLGLALARAIVHAHEGELSAESWLGQGSTFIIAVPS